MPSTMIPGVVVSRRPRNETVGSTDARIIASGLGWFDLYLEKIGEKQRPDLRFAWKPRLGIETEKLHAWWHEHTEQVKLHPQINDDPLTRPDLPPHHTTSIDRLVMGAPLELLELKHTNERATLRDKAIYYMPQLQWQLHVTGLQRVRFSIIRGNNEPEWGYVDRDQDYIDKLVAQVDAFWWHVTEREAPDPDPVEGKAERAALAKAAREVPLNGFKPYDWSTNNEWVSAAHDFIRDKRAAESLKTTEPKIRGMIPKDAEIVKGGGLSFKRDARGAYRVTIDEDA